MSMSPLGNSLGLEVEDRGRDGVYTLVLSGELDVASLATFEAAMSRLYVDGTIAITLDLSGLRFIDSSGLGAIIHAGKLCERHGYGFSLLPGPRSVQRLFELTGLLDLLPFREASSTTASSGGEADGALPDG
jgi:anti-anti-sigma factor